MDILQDALSSLISNLTSSSPPPTPSLSSFSSTQALRLILSYVSTYTTTIFSLLPLPIPPALIYALKTGGTYLSTLDPSSLTLTTTLILLAGAYISYRILDYVRRIVLFWLFLALRITLVFVAIQAAVYVHRNGVEKSVAEAAWLWGVIYGMVQGTTEKLGENRLGRGERGGAGAGAGVRNTWADGRRQYPTTTRRRWTQ